MVAFERVFASRDGDGTSCGYMARVKVRVRLQEGVRILREGTGFGQASATSPGEAHERALKSAETDATKQALATFGGRFGLLLHDGKDRLEPKRLSREPSASKAANRETQAQKREQLGSAETVPGGPEAPWRIGHGGTGFAVASAESFCSSLRQLVEAAETAKDLECLKRDNQAGLERLRAQPQLRSPHGVHYADILESLIAVRIKALDGRHPSPEEPHTQDGPHAATDRAARPIGRTAQSYVPVPPYPLARLVERVAPPAPSSSLTSLPEPVPSPAASRTEPVLVEVADRPCFSNAAQDPGLTIAAAAPGEGSVALPAMTACTNAVAPIATPTRRSQISSGFSIDKSVLAIPSERRLRSKAHLAQVAAAPCLVCQTLPCHAHHITFAQPRGLSQKVSDEYTVPLCALHHNELHAFGNEASWWRNQGIEPLAHARALWLLNAAPQAEPQGPVDAVVPNAR